MRVRKYLRSIAPLVLLALVTITAVAPELADVGGRARAMGAPRPPAAPVGSAMVSGTVYLNDLPVQGPTLALASGDRLETAARAGAVLTISGRDNLVLSENSAVTMVGKPQGVTAELGRGRVLVTSTHERLREVRLSGDAVSVRGAPGVQRRYQVSRLPDATYVAARAGSITVFDEGYASQTEVPEGKVAAVRAEAEALVPPPRPQAQPQRPGAPAPAGGRAGQISAAIPKDYIQRGAQTLEGNRGDEIRWNDLLRTEDRGRVRLTLDDGSILNVGSGSRLQVVEHNNKTQQTSLQLQYGRVRAQVVKMTQPGASFQIRTNTAVCGVLGTDFYVEADERSTRVVVFKGIVRVTSLAAAAIAGIAVGAGQATSATSGTVASPASATAGQVQGAISSTQAAGSGAAGAGAGAAGAAASRVGLVTAVPAVAVSAATIPAFSNPSPSRP